MDYSDVQIHSNDESVKNVNNLDYLNEALRQSSSLGNYQKELTEAKLDVQGSLFNPFLW